MKTSCLVIFVAASIVACAHYVETSSATVARWQQRDIAELIAAIGPYDTTSIKGDSRSYNWFRFGNCRLTARTTLEDKIEQIELEGTGLGCEVYRQKMGA
jgi:hypothetical protein